MKYSLRKWLAATLTSLLLLNVARANDQDPVQKSMTLLRKTTLALLQDGNSRFVSGDLKHPNTGLGHRSVAAIEGQEPFATVLSCSDSRVPVELIFDRGVGEIFTVRVAGNVADTDEIATIEYGVGHLHTPVVVVMGHTRCGAVTAVVKGVELDGLLPQLVDNIKPAAETARQQGGEEPAIIANAIKANVWQSISDVLRRSAIVRRELQAGTVSVVGAVYNIEAGTVEWLGEHPDQKSIVNAYKPEIQAVVAEPVNVVSKGPSPEIKGPPKASAAAAKAAPAESAAHATHGH